MYCVLFSPTFYIVLLHRAIYQGHQIHHLKTPIKRLQTTMTQLKFDNIMKCLEIIRKTFVAEVYRMLIHIDMKHCSFEPPETRENLKKHEKYETFDIYKYHSKLNDMHHKRNLKMYSNFYKLKICHNLIESNMFSLIYFSLCRKLLAYKKEKIYFITTLCLYQLYCLQNLKPFQTIKLFL